ncbi:MAG TPA: pre-peptidase C-terminal domain-containing protein [Allosphingosinicella sp.]
MGLPTLQLANLSTPATIGTEFLVNSSTPGHQERSKIAALTNGNFVSVWWNSTTEIIAQLFDYNGNKLGTAVLVNTFNSGAQGLPEIAPLSGGGCVIVWQDGLNQVSVGSGTLGDSSGTSIKAQIFDNTLQKIGTEFLVNTVTTSYQLNPYVSGLPNGNFIITWQDGSISSINSEVKGQLFSSEGQYISGEFLINTTSAGDQLPTSVTALTNGSFIVCWWDAAQARAQIFSSSLMKVGGEISISSLSRIGAKIAALDNGGFVAVWETVPGASADSSGAAIQGQIFSLSGEPIGSVFLVNSAVANDQLAPSIASLPGGFIVTWDDHSGVGGDSSGGSVKAQVFDLNGSKVGDEFRVNSTTFLDQYDSSVAVLANGTALATWTDTSGTDSTVNDPNIRAQILSVPAIPVTDDYADGDLDSTSAVGALVVGGSLAGFLGPADSDDTSGDKDVFKVHLLANQTYRFELSGTTLPFGIFTIRDGSNFAQVLRSSASSHSVAEIFTPEVEGDYYVRVGSGGAVGDQGGYSLAVMAVQAELQSDDFPDYPGDTGAISGIQAIALGGSRVGALDMVGDKDVFSFSVTQGHSYQISVTGELVGNFGSLSTLYATARAGDDFSHVLAGSGNGQQSILRFASDASGVAYVRVGAGGSGIATGGYRVSVSDIGVVPPTADAPPGSPALDAGMQWIDNRKYELLHLTLDFDDAIFSSLKIIASNVDAAGAAKLATYFESAFSGFGFLLTVGGYADRVIHASDPTEALYVEGFKILWGVAASQTGATVGGLLGLLSGGLAVPAGVIAGELFGNLVYNFYLEDKVEQYFDLKWDGIDDYGHSGVTTNVPSNSSVGGASTNGPEELDESLLIFFDEDFYLASHLEVATAITSGSIGRALDHFLTIGIDLGYKPNAGQQITRADLPFDVINNDPAARGSASLLTMNLGAHAGDGFSAAEASLAAALNDARNTASDFAVDGRLSALAARKAGDLVANIPGSAIDLAIGQTDSGWAAEWSNGNPFAQQFRSFVEELNGSNVDGSRYRLFVVASQGASPADLLAALANQSGFSLLLQDAVFDTIGVAEYGGIWVVIAADRETGYSTSPVSTDTLDHVSIYGDADPNLLYSGPRPSLLYGQEGNDHLIAGDSTDILEGGAGDDILVGGLGADRMRGGANNDLYYVDNAGDVIVEMVGEGYDVLAAGVSYTLGAGVSIELLTTGWIAGTAAFDFTGNELANQIWGNDGVNTINGGGGNDELFGFGGNDTLVGGTGNDTMFIDAAGDTIVEAADEGYDVVAAGVSYVLAAGAEIELITTGFIGGLAAIDFTGNEFANQIWGNTAGNILGGGGGNDALFGFGGNDILVGGTGADLLAGGTGNDTMFVDDAGDIALESIGEGYDVVAAALSYTLRAGSEIELLTTGFIAGTAAIDFTGNELANQIWGNDGVNILNGGGGNDELFGFGGSDTLVGGTGNDTMFIDSAGDNIVEAADEGYDVVAAGLSYTLGAGVEIELITTGFIGGIAAIDFTGNDFTNQIWGNAAGNILNGGGGNDALFGFDGNDTLNGGTGSDALFGGNGADTIDGGADSDTLIGESGADIFAFTTTLGATNVDTITDFVSGADRIALDDAVFVGIGGLGALNANAFVNGTTAQDADDRILYDAATGNLFFDADGNGAGAAVLFATLQGHPPIAASDFMVI